METLEQELKRLEARLLLLNVNSTGKERIEQRIAEIKHKLEGEKGVQS